MGMYDEFHVKEKNKVGIPVGCYQSKSLGCSLANIIITEEGRLVLDYIGDKFYKNEEAERIEAGTFSDTDVNIYGDNDEGVWEDYYLVIHNNQIVRVELNNDLIYLAAGYPMLDKTLNPVPEGHYLDVVPGSDIEFYHRPYRQVDPADYATGLMLQSFLSSKHHARSKPYTPGQVIREFVEKADGQAKNRLLCGTPIPIQNMSVFTALLPNGEAGLWGLIHDHGNPVGTVQPIRPGAFDTPQPVRFEGGMADDLGLMYPVPMKALGVDPHPTLPKAGVLTFRDGKPVVYEKLEPPAPTPEEMGNFVREAVVSGQKIHVDCSVDPDDPHTMRVDLSTDGTPAEYLSGMTPKVLLNLPLADFPHGTVEGLDKIISEQALKHFGQPGNRECDGPITYLDENGVRRLDVLAMLRRQKARAFRTPVNYAMEAVLRGRRDIHLVVFERRSDGDKGHRYSKAIQSITLRNKD